MSNQSNIPARPPLKPVRGYIGLEIPEDLLRSLKGLMPPDYPSFRGHHITLKFGVDMSSTETAEIVQRFHNAQVDFVGFANDQNAVQCFIVRVNGQTHNLDGDPYHLTWSLDDKKEVPGHYNRDGKSCPANSYHASYIAEQKAFITLWPEECRIQTRLSARFYPSESASVNAAPGQGL